MTKSHRRGVYEANVKRAIVFGLGAAVVAGLTGCAVTQRAAVSPRVGSRIVIPADPPPSPATWPAYPRFSQHSCWGRPIWPPPRKPTRLPEMQVAPSYAPAHTTHPTPPAEIVRRFLARFGDRRYVRSIALTAPPPAVGSNVHVLYAGGHPPSDALALVIHAPLSNDGNDSTPPTPVESLTRGIASWEAGLVFGALEDDFCSAGGPSLIWASGDAGGMANRVFALEQRFPNPSPTAFRRRVDLVGERYGFRVVSLRLLRPEQIAPLLIVKTSRNRRRFAGDVEKIMSLLDPTASGHRQSASTFEGFFFAAEDTKGPFLFLDGASRGQGEGGEWAAGPCLYPTPPLSAPGAPECKFGQASSQ